MSLDRRARRGPRLVRGRAAAAWVAVGVAVCLGASGCAPSGADTVSPSSTTADAAGVGQVGTGDAGAGAARPVGGPPAGPTRRLDMDAIFPQGDGRDLVLDNCTVCHSFPRIVLTQRSVERWAAVRQSMGPRVAALSPQEVDRLFTYLETHFNDTQPEPKIPAWFLEVVPW